MTNPQRIELKGSPREIGLEHGRLLADNIRSQIEVYDSMFQHTSNLQWSDVREVAKEYASTIQQLTPDLFTEMEAIAEGAGLDILDIAALNCRSEISLGLFSDGCSALGWVRRIQGFDEVLLAQNWDWTPRVKNNLVLMSIEQTGKPKIYMANEAGLVGKIGFNSSSVGVLLNAIRAKPTVPSKIPVHVALRLCLESSSAKSAIEKLESLGGIASAQHILIADTSGPTCLELSPVGNVYIEPDSDGIACHTNHFLKNKLVHEPPWLAGSPVRLERTVKLAKELADRGGAVNGQSLRHHVFSDIFNAPQSICCQEDKSLPVQTRAVTLFCIVMVFSRNKSPSAEIVWGQPGIEKQGEVLRMPW